MLNTIVSHLLVKRYINIKNNFENKNLSFDGFGKSQPNNVENTRSNPFSKCLSRFNGNGNWKPIFSLIKKVSAADDPEKAIKEANEAIERAEELKKEIKEALEKVEETHKDNLKELEKIREQEKD